MSIAWVILQTANQPAAQPPSGGAMFVQFLPIILIFVVMYFFLIRPQAKKAKEHQKMLDAIAAGTEIVTSSGIHGTVKGMKGANNEIVILQVAEGMKIEIDRASIGRVKGPDGK